MKKLIIAMAFIFTTGVLSSFSNAKVITRMVTHDKKNLGSGDYKLNEKKNFVSSDYKIVVTSLSHNNKKNLASGD